MVDIDFLVTDYDHGKPVAIIEYKHELADEKNTHDMSYRALKALANASKIPCFVCRYSAGLDLFKPQSLNGFAKDHMLDGKTMTEEEWVGFLYELRGREVPPAVLAEIRKRENAAGTVNRTPTQDDNQQHWTFNPPPETIEHLDAIQNKLWMENHP
jgi:hypothetical protein